MSAHELVRLLDVLDELGPEPFLRCGCLECLEVVEAWTAPEWEEELAA